MVLAALAYAAQHHNNSRVNSALHCYVTTSAPDCSGAKMTKALSKLRINCTLIPDTAVAYLMPQIDAVVLGAEAVVESGGILNRLGTSGVAMIATSFGKPVYVLAESFKFFRSFPLDQRHIPEEFKWPTGRPGTGEPLRDIDLLTDSPAVVDNDDFPELNTVWDRVNRCRIPIVEQVMPDVDYTDPCYITYLVTDLGVLTPSVVSDELIKLYL